jgi:hypothetical protein
MMWYHMRYVVLIRMGMVCVILVLAACGSVTNYIVSNPQTLVGESDDFKLVKIKPYYANLKGIKADESEFLISPMNDVADSGYSFILFIPFDKHGRMEGLVNKRPFIVEVQYRLSADAKWELINPALNLNGSIYKAVFYRKCYGNKAEPQEEVPLPYTIKAHSNAGTSGTGVKFSCARLEFPVETPRPEVHYTVNLGYLDLKGKTIPFVVKFGPIHYTSGGG